MAFKLKISNTVTFQVAGKLSDAEGRPVPFSFRLMANRVPMSELQTLVREKDMPMNEFLAPKVVGWESVHDEDGRAVEFSPDGLAQLFEIPGMVTLAYAAYLEACGAKGKVGN